MDFATELSELPNNLEQGKTQHPIFHLFFCTSYLMYEETTCNY